MIDTNGPKIRTGKLKDGKPVYLEVGSKFTFVNDPSFIGNSSAVASSYTRRIVQPGDNIYVDDGLLSFTVDSIDEQLNQVHCTVDNSGFLGENKGINLPGYLPEDLPALREKDIEDIKVTSNGISNSIGNSNLI